MIQERFLFKMIDCKIVILIIISLHGKMNVFCEYLQNLMTLFQKDFYFYIKLQLLMTKDILDMTIYY